MRRYVIFLLMLTGLLACRVALAAPDDRFKGAAYDGYAKSAADDVSIPPPGFRRTIFTFR